MKQVKLQTKYDNEGMIPAEVLIPIGKADIQKMPDGSVRAVITFSNTDVIAQLGGNCFNGTITNYTGDDPGGNDGGNA